MQIFPETADFTPLEGTRLLLGNPVLRADVLGGFEFLKMESLY